MSKNRNVVNAFNNASLICSLSSDEFDLYLEVIRLITEIRDTKGFSTNNYFEFYLSVGIDIYEFTKVIRSLGIKCNLPNIENHSLTIFPD